VDESGHPRDEHAVRIRAADAPVQDAVIMEVEIRRDRPGGVSFVEVQGGPVGNDDQDRDAYEQDDNGGGTQEAPF
jgi:hypothetical protein